MTSASLSEKFPDIKRYLSIQLYIKDIYEYRKSQNAKFSYLVWAQEIGIKNRSYLRLIITGRRPLSEEISELLKRHLKLDENECEYFTYLVLYSQSKRQEQKKIYGRKLIQIIKKDLGQVEIDPYYEFVTDPLLPKLRTLLSYQAFSGSLAAISAAFDIPEKQVEKSVEKLVGLGLAQPQDSNPLAWKATAQSVKVTDRPGDLALEIFHTQSLQTAIEAQRLSAVERRFRSLLLAMSEKEYQKFLENFQTFVEEQLADHDTQSITDRRLYQMNFNMIPVSKKLTTN